MLANLQLGVCGSREIATSPHNIKTAASLLPYADKVEHFHQYGIAGIGNASVYHLIRGEPKPTEVGEYYPIIIRTALRADPSSPSLGSRLAQAGPCRQCTALPAGHRG